MTTRERLDVLLSSVDGGGTFTEAYLDMLCADAEQVVNHYRNTTTIESRYVPVASRIAFYWLEKTGFSGAISVSENGVSRAYEQGDIPNSLLRQIVPTAVLL